MEKSDQEKRKMKVFYVVVLVLVAGAVPSHGRTESDGTVFNKIQPHESMSNVTVSSSKLVRYHLSYLVMQWPRSFCNYLNMDNRQCNQVVHPARFTVHGLWPQYKPDYGIDCWRLNQPIRRIRPFNFNLPNFVEFLPDLNHYWPDLETVKGCNHIFWGNEYDKHGSCTFNDQIRYFKLTLALARNFGNQISQPTGIGGIIFDRRYSSHEIKFVVYEVNKIWPRLHCVPDGDRFLLMEIRFCVINDRLTSCDDFTDCGSQNVQNVYLPRP